MLDEEEWAVVDQLPHEGVRATKEFRRKHGLPLESLDLDTRFRPALDAYERITGFRETNYRALYHHRISIYGPPCTHCGKPLRTPQASRCVACGTRRTD